MQNQISNIQIVPIKPKDGLVAFVSFTFNDSFYFSSIGIYTRPQGGYRLSYPTRKASNNNFSVYHPIQKDVATAIEQAIIDKYEDILSDEL